MGSRPFYKAYVVFSAEHASELFRERSDNLRLACAEMASPHHPVLVVLTKTESQKDWRYEITKIENDGELQLNQVKGRVRVKR